MDYEVGLTSNNSSLAVNKKGLWSQKTLLLKRLKAFQILILIMTFANK